MKTFLLINNFFSIDFSNDKDNNIFNYLCSYLSVNKVFRIATYEVMLINIQMIAKIFLEKNNKSEEAKNQILVKLVNLIHGQYIK